MKLFIAAVLAAFSIQAHAFTELFRWEQPLGSVTQLSIPMRGGMLLLDQKRKGSETQWVSFQLKFNDYFDKFNHTNGGHAFALVDSFFNVLPTGIPYSGRGGAFFKDRICAERFDTQDLQGCAPFTFNGIETYTVVVHASATHVAIFVFEPQGTFQVPVQVFYLCVPMEDRLQGIANISTIAIGAVGESDESSIPAVLFLSNLKQGRFN